jgi:hypothetical protein
MTGATGVRDPSKISTMAVKQFGLSRLAHSR